MAGNNTYIVPNINSSGTFTCLPPFDKILPDIQLLKVTAIRSIKELFDSNEDPYTNIYAPVGLSSDDFKNDFNNNVPIIVLVAVNDYYYIPASYIITTPLNNGIQYQQAILSIMLGNLPVTYDLDNLKSQLADTVQQVVGIKTVVTRVPSSAIFLKTEVEDATYMLRLNTAKINQKSMLTRYNELLTKFNATKTMLTTLQTYAGMLLTGGSDISTELKILNHINYAVEFMNNYNGVISSNTNNPFFDSATSASTI